MPRAVAVATTAWSAGAEVRARCGAGGRADRILHRWSSQWDRSRALAKPLGLGVAPVALRRGLDTPEFSAAAAEVRSSLRAEAGVVARASGATGATDVPGFSLLGRLRKMAVLSSWDAVVDASATLFCQVVRSSGWIWSVARRQMQSFAGRVTPPRLPSAYVPTRGC